MKIRVKFDFGFPVKTDNGNKLFPILHFAYGNNGFQIGILGLRITILKQRP